MEKVGVSLSFSRAGDNIFVDGLPKSFGSVHLKPALTKAELIADKGGNSYIQAEIFKCNGMKVWLKRVKDDEVLQLWLIQGPEGEITYDPWEFIQVPALVEGVIV